MAILKSVQLDIQRDEATRVIRKIDYIDHAKPLHELGKPATEEDGDFDDEKKYAKKPKSLTQEYFEHDKNGGF